jgi:Transposase DDE domain group 1
MPTECIPELFEFPRVDSRAVVADFNGGRITSDAGALLLGQTDRALNLTHRLADCFTDARSPGLVEHAVETLLLQRITGIALGYEDLCDHDTLRHDPVLAVLAGKLEAKRKACAPLAGKSTLNRVEHGGAVPTRYHKIAANAGAIEALFVDLFLDAHQRAPSRIILDLDATDDPLHGNQEGRFFHGYYDCYCYLPLYIFCGHHLLAATLRRANIDAAAGATDEIARVIERLRARWPKTRILLRADSGFCREEIMAWCEANRVDYVFGLARNERLQNEIASEMEVARAMAERTGKPARRFRDFRWSTRNSWSRERRVIAKAEWTNGEANPRFIVRPGSRASTPHSADGWPVAERRSRPYVPRANSTPALRTGALNAFHKGTIRQSRWQTKGTEGSRRSRARIHHGRASNVGPYLHRRRRATRRAGFRRERTSRQGLGQAETGR